MGGLVDAELLNSGLWSLAWALFAVVAGFGAGAAARTLLERRDDDEAMWARGYNALAPMVDR
ncbi:hypothetical protein U91I_03839 [alpha proteobacterium U9-1i]|nr:hypothetical protein U91I_03839 [alpha proteobacterium U9-1i]